MEEKKIGEFRVLKGFWIFTAIYFALLTTYSIITKGPTFAEGRLGILVAFLWSSFGYKELKKLHGEMKNMPEFDEVFQKLFPLGMIWGKINLFHRVLKKHNVDDPELLRLARLIDIKGRAWQYFLLITLVYYLFFALVINY